jgi:outer membrane murein-binding lipoprotein Lpp
MAMMSLNLSGCISRAYCEQLSAIANENRNGSLDLDKDNDIESTIATNVIIFTTDTTFGLK